MKPAVLILTFLAVFVCTSMAEPSPEGALRRRFSPKHFPIGSSRAATEKRIAAPEIGEEEADHGFAPLLDVYYELDAQWCALACYSVPNGVLVVQPRLVANTPGLHTRLHKPTPILSSPVA